MQKVKEKSISHVYPSFLSNPEEVDELEKYVASLFGPSKKMIDAKESKLLYNLALRKAIKANNIPGINVLWLASEFEGQYGPRFDKDLKVACEFSNLKTVQYVLRRPYDWGYTPNCPKYNHLSALSKDPLVKSYFDGIYHLTKKLDDIAEMQEDINEYYDRLDMRDEISNYTKLFNDAKGV